MQLLPYNHDMVHMFSKETDYVIHTKYGQTRIAGLFKTRHGFDDDDCSNYQWTTAEGMKVIPGEDITHWGNINI